MSLKYRNHIVVLLLLCFISPLCLNYAFLKFRQYQIKEEVKLSLLKGIEPAQLVTLRFTKEEADIALDWEHSREFEYNGQMYDVVSEEIKGDSIIYKVWWDKAETKIKKELSTLVATFLQNDMESQPFQQQLSYFWNHLQCQSLVGWDAQVKWSEQTFVYFHKPSVIRNIEFAPPVPPPDFS